jgi:hypothetical protein
MSACPGAASLTVKVGQAIKTTVTWVNTGSQSYNFDVIVIMCDYDPSTGNITNAYLIGKALDQPSSPGQSITTSMTSATVPSGLVRATPYDLIVAICDWDDVNSKFTTIYTACISTDIITVSS